MKSQNLEKQGNYLAYKPKDMSLKAWTEIITAWENGLSDREASFRASKYNETKVTEAELRKLCNDSPEIADLREFLQTALVAQAKLNIADSIKEGSVSTAKWLLERKAPEEYSSKAAIAFAGAVAELSVEDKMSEMEEFMNQFRIEEVKKDELTDGEDDGGQ